uniref:B30.2/SPRY domain-containing protein n=1 Tax=Astyanax mexicanus TaxID=7994 RepID=A0A8B9HWV6_ASTMX
PGSFLMCFFLTLRKIAPVTLDPNTAHPNLHLSDDLTAVEKRDQRSSVPDNPERFDERRCVLGSEGFNSGTHCWDVQVGEHDTWVLGLIPESVTRKGYSFWNSVWSLDYDKSITKYGIRCPGQSVLFLTPKEKGKLTFTDLLTNTHLPIFTLVSSLTRL